MFMTQESNHDVEIRDLSPLEFKEKFRITECVDQMN